MSDFAEPVERLIDQLKHLPGIGAKTAQRLAFYILRSDAESALALADAARVNRPDLKILLMTGYAENAASKSFLGANMEIVVKPFAIDAVSRKIRAMINANSTPRG